MANPLDPNDRGARWRLVGLGVLLIVAGVAGVVFAWFPAPPHSTAAPLSGWTARCFAAGVGCFGLAVAVVAVPGRPGGGVSHSRRQAGCGSLVLALVSWAAWLVSMLS
jgi:hypothetical protein